MNSTRSSASELAKMAIVGERIILHWNDPKIDPITGVVRQKSRAGMHLKLTGTVMQPKNGHGQLERIAVKGEVVVVPWVCVKRVIRGRARPVVRRGAA